MYFPPCSDIYFRMEPVCDVSEKRSIVSPLQGAIMGLDKFPLASAAEIAMENVTFHILFTIVKYRYSKSGIIDVRDRSAIVV